MMAGAVYSSPQTVLLDSSTAQPRNSMKESPHRVPVKAPILALPIVLIVGLVFCCLPAAAQEQFDLRLDHSTVLVTDLEISGAFYENVLGLAAVDTPWGPAAPIRFYSLGGARQLHMGVSDSAIAPDKNVHLAFAVSNFDTYLAFLRKQRVEYTNFAGTRKEPQVRPDGVRQVYLQDPDGNWIEINDARHAPPSAAKR